MVVQWLRLCVPSAGGLGLIFGQGTRSHMPQLRPSAAKKKQTIRVEFPSLSMAEKPLMGAFWVVADGSG